MDILDTEGDGGDGGTMPLLLLLLLKRDGGAGGTLPLLLLLLLTVLPVVASGTLAAVIAARSSKCCLGPGDATPLRC
jgi:hypothetical protein